MKLNREKKGKKKNYLLNCIKWMGVWEVLKNIIGVGKLMYRLIPL